MFAALRVCRFEIEKRQRKLVSGGWVVSLDNAGCGRCRLFCRFNHPGFACFKTRDVQEARDVHRFTRQAAAQNIVRAGHDFNARAIEVRVQNACGQVQTLTATS